MSSMSSTIVKVLLDTTYLLPIFGIEVEGLSSDDIEKLRNLKIERRIELYYSPIIWIEILGKICRELAKRRMKMEDIEHITELATKSLIESEFFKQILPGVDAIKLALKLRIHGHRDNIDNILYSISIENDMIFLTMDEELKKFLEENNYKTDNVMNHKQLFKQLTHTK